MAAGKKKSYRQKRALNLDGPASQLVVDKNPARNIKYHEIAKEFVNNGCRQTLAYATVTGNNPRTCGTQATRLFRKPFMTELIRGYITGDHEAPRTKEWALKKWQEMVEANVLNYLTDEGDWLTVAELRELPKAEQQAIKKIKVRTIEEPVMLNGEMIMDNGKPIMTTTQKVEIELYDRQKALSDMARAEKWIETHMNVSISAPVGADLLINAQVERQKRLEGRVIEGEVLEQKHD